MMKFPRWLSWIVLIGLGWLLFVGNTRDYYADQPAPGTATEPAVTVSNEPKRYREIEALLDGERWKKGLFPNYESADDACRMEAPAEGKLHAYALVLAAGSGDELACGASAEFTVARRNADGSEGKPSNATLTLGEQKGFDGLLLGMRSGERRLLIVSIPAKLEKLPTLPAKTLLIVDVTRTAQPKDPAN